MKFLYSILFVTLICYSSCEVASEDDEPKSNTPARLLVEKRILNDYLVENQNINIKYSIYNVGGNDAQNIQLNDNNLPDQYFEKLNATSSLRVANLIPNGKVEQTLVYKPKIGTWGRVNFTSAEVIYQSKESGATLRTESSEPGSGYIISIEDYEKRFSLHLFEWSVFGGLSVISVLLPYLLYNGSKSKYEAIKKAK